MRLIVDMRENFSARNNMGSWGGFGKIERMSCRRSVCCGSGVYWIGRAECLMMSVSSQGD